MTRRILIVDDHAGFRRSASRNLASAGWEVVGEAEDGEAALAAAERFEPDVVLLDVGLPDVSGIEVARRLHERLPDVAVVMISTQDREDYGELALASGARGFLTKLDLSSQALEALVESIECHAWRCRIEQTVARAVSSATDVGDAYTRALEAIGTDLDWNLAAAWEPKAGGEALLLRRPLVAAGATPTRSPR